MTRDKRLVLLHQYIDKLNIDVSDIPYNENRFTISATPDDRGYGVTFMFVDEATKEGETFYTRWYPLKTKTGYLYGMDIIDRFNSFIIERRYY